MHGLGQAVADTGDRAEQVGARAQMCHFTQELRRHRLGLDGVGQRVFDPADDLKALALDLKALALALRLHQRAGGDHRAARGEPLDVLEIAQRLGGYDLDRRKARAIADVDEGQSCRAAHCAHPPANRDFSAFRELPGKGVCNADHRHDMNPLLIDSICECEILAAVSPGRRGIYQRLQYATAAPTYNWPVILLESPHHGCSFDPRRPFPGAAFC
ncbi:hypothetical protein D3C71_1331140 [compost metagenome]